MNVHRRSATVDPPSVEIASSPLVSPAAALTSFFITDLKNVPSTFLSVTRLYQRPWPLCSSSPER
eukprot:jgi/Pico_ML_1/53010/g3632.t1